MRTGIALAAVLISSVAAEAADFQVLTSKDPKLAWKSVELPGGKTANYTLGMRRRSTRSSSTARPGPSSCST